MLKYSALLLLFIDWLVFIYEVRLHSLYAELLLQDILVRVVAGDRVYLRPVVDEIKITTLDKTVLLF